MWAIKVNAEHRQQRYTREFKLKAVPESKVGATAGIRQLAGRLGGKLPAVLGKSHDGR